MVFMGSARKRQDTSTRIALNAKHSNGSGSGKKCSSCGKDGHTDASCWKKFPDKGPQWYKDSNKKGEAAGSSVEVVLATLDEPDFKKQDFHVACL